MGEMQGNMWSSLLFIIMFSGIMMLVFSIIDYGQIYSTKMAIEDNIKNGNYTYFQELDTDKYSPCTGTYPYSTTENCSGITKIDKTNRIVYYQMTFNGLNIDWDASSTKDISVLLPY